MKVRTHKSIVLGLAAILSFASTSAEAARRRVTAADRPSVAQTQPRVPVSTGSSGSSNSSSSSGSNPGSNPFQNIDFNKFLRDSLGQIPNSGQAGIPNLGDINVPDFSQMPTGQVPQFPAAGQMPTGQVPRLPASGQIPQLPTGGMQQIPSQFDFSQIQQKLQACQASAEALQTKAHQLQEQCRATFENVDLSSVDQAQLEELFNQCSQQLQAIQQELSQGFQTCIQSALPATGMP